MHRGTGGSRDPHFLEWGTGPPLFESIMSEILPSKQVMMQSQDRALHYSASPSKNTSFWKFSTRSNSKMSLNWSTIDEVTTRKTTAYFFGPLSITTTRSRHSHNWSHDVTIIGQISRCGRSRVDRSITTAARSSIQNAHSPVFTLLLITSLILPHLNSSLLTSFLLNWARCDWSQPRPTGSLHSARTSSPCLTRLRRNKQWCPWYWSSDVLNYNTSVVGPTASTFVDASLTRGLSPC